MSSPFPSPYHLLSSHFHGYLLELQEHADLMAGVQMRNVRQKKKQKRFFRDRIEKRFDRTGTITCAQLMLKQPYKCFV